MIPTAPTTSAWTGRRVVLATLMVLSVMLAFYLLYRFYLVVFILFVAIVIGVAIRPLVDRLYRVGIPRGAGVLIVYALLLVLVTGFFLLLTPLIVDQVSTISGRAPEYYKTLVGYILGSRSILVRQLGLYLPATINLNPAAPAANQAGFDTAAQVLGLAGTAIRTIFLGTSILALAFYWTLDGQRTLRGLVLRAPLSQREVILETIGEMEEKVGAYVRGVIILSVALAVMAGVAYLIIGLPYALVLGVIAGVLETLPVIGPVLGAVPPVLLALSLEPSKVIWVIVAVVLIQQIEGNLLVPRVMDRSVGVNAIVTILAIFAFGALFGLGGAIMAIPLAAVIQVVINRYVFTPPATSVESPDARNRYSMLRYQAQELIQDVRKQVRRKEDDTDSEADLVEDQIEAIATDLDSTLAQLEAPEVATA